jgi:glutamine synthetase
MVSDSATPRRGLLTLEQLRVAVGEGEIDTVVLAFTDMQGRLAGKRLSAEFFLDEVAEHYSEGCNYLLAVDVDMNTVDGYAMSSWERGYGDFVLVPDMSTLRQVPWQQGTVMVTADLTWLDGTPVAASPRQILKAQTARLAERGLVALAGTELEFIVYRDTYEEAAAKEYRDLIPANTYNVDYSILGTARIEPLLRRIRLGMAGAGLYVESAKGECNLGQHEIAFRYAEAVTTCDNHSIYKTGAKEIAAQDGMSITFMAKPNAREGNSCHIHLSVRSASDGAPVMAGDGAYGMSRLGEHFLAGLLDAMRELTLCYAPNINSYKRYVPGSFAPTSVRWGPDNRTCALRLVGHGPSLRVENRTPGGDVNPYLAVAAMIAAGLHGIDHELPLEPPVTGNAYLDSAAKVPHTLRDALELWEKSGLARQAFGAEVVEHYANYARVELAAYDAAVTDWELRRGFERLLSGGARACPSLPCSTLPRRSRSPPWSRSRRRRPISRLPGRRRHGRRGARSRPATGPGCCVRSPRRSILLPRSSPGWRWPARAIR